MQVLVVAADSKNADSPARMGGWEGAVIAADVMIAEVSDVAVEVAVAVARVERATDVMNGDAAEEVGRCVAVAAVGRTTWLLLKRCRQVDVDYSIELAAGKTIGNCCCQQLHGYLMRP